MRSQLFSIFSLALFFTASVSFTACEKEDITDSALHKMTDEEALDILTGALVYSTEGLTTDAVDAAYIADGSIEKDLTILACGESADSLFVRNYTGNRFSSSYEHYLEWGLECTPAGLPSALTFGREMTGSYESNRIISDDEANSDWVIENLITGPNYVLNGNYERNGTQESTVREMRSFASTLLITVDNLNLDKGERRIVSGIATFELSGTVSSGEHFSYEGSIVFLGDGMATILLNGNSYTIDLY